MANLHNYIFVSKSDPKGNSVLIALRDFQYFGDLGRSISMLKIRDSSGAIHDPQYVPRWSVSPASDSVAQLAERQTHNR